MLIECIIRRPAGSNIDLTEPGGATALYRFAPLIEGGAHLCDVSNPVHVARLLEIEESFRPAEMLETLSPPLTPSEDGKPPRRGPSAKRDA